MHGPGFRIFGRSADGPPVGGTARSGRLRPAGGGLAPRARVGRAPLGYRDPGLGVPRRGRGWGRYSFVAGDPAAILVVDAAGLHLRAVARELPTGEPSRRLTPREALRAA